MTFYLSDDPALLAAVRLYSPATLNGPVKSPPCYSSLRVLLVVATCGLMLSYWIPWTMNLPRAPVSEVLILTLSCNMGDLPPWKRAARRHRLTHSLDSETPTSLHS